MMTTREEFWEILRGYATGIAPVQFVFYGAAALAVVWLLLKPGKLPSLVAKLYLAAAFAWNGLVFYMMLARDMSGDGYGSYFFGLVFIVVSALYAIDLFRQRMQFSLPTEGWQRHGTQFLLLLVFCYPLLGALLGHPLTALVFPGTFPCPTVALALLLLTTALPQVDRTIFVLLLFCAIPFTPFVQIARFGVYEDFILLAAGLFSLFLLLRSWKPRERPA
jgi:hypothetical protein